MFWGCLLKDTTFNKHQPSSKEMGHSLWHREAMSADSRCNVLRISSLCVVKQGTMIVLFYILGKNKMC